MQTDLHIKIRQVVEEPNDNHELLESVKAFCLELGVENFFFASSLFNTSNTTPDLRTLSDYPAEWKHRYYEANYIESDHTISHSRSNSSPLVWLDSDVALDKKNKRIFAEASEFGIISGITFPYHGVGCEFGSFSGTVATKFRHSALDSITTQHTLYLLGAALFDLHQNAIDPVYAGKLTQREKECLRWVAEGKTSWEIALVLSISERTACFHLDNARKKLNAATRTSAVTKALIHSLL